MRKFLRLIIVVVLAAAAWAVARYEPNLVHASLVQAASGLVTILVVVVGYFARQLAVTTGTGTLRGREMERYATLRSDIRRRMYYLVAFGALAAALLWIVGAILQTELDVNREILAVVAAVIVGAIIGYILSVVRWIDEIAEFSDTLRVRKSKDDDYADTMKRRAEASKRSTNKVPT